MYTFQFTQKGTEQALTHPEPPGGINTTGDCIEIL